MKTCDKCNLPFPDGASVKNIDTGFNRCHQCYLIENFDYVKASISEMDRCHEQTNRWIVGLSIVIMILIIMK